MAIKENISFNRWGVSKAILPAGVIRRLKSPKLIDANEGILLLFIVYGTDIILIKGDSSTFSPIVQRKSPMDILRVNMYSLLSSYIINNSTLKSEHNQDETNGV